VKKPKVKKHSFKCGGMKKVKGSNVPVCKNCEAPKEGHA
jgi:hypothetical protein